MPRPRKAWPEIKRRERDGVVYLRVWWADRYHSVGRDGDDPEATRRKIQFIMSTSERPPRKAALPGAKGLTVSGLFTAFLKSDDAPQDPRDRYLVRQAGLYFAEFAGAVPAAGLKAETVEAWRDWLCTKKARRGAGSKGQAVEMEKTLSRQYILRLMKSLRRAYRFGVAKDLVPEVLAYRISSVSPPRPGRARLAPRRSAADPASAEAILPMLPPMLATMIRTLRASGMRPGDLCNLTPGEVHRSGVVRIPGGQIVDMDAARAKAEAAGKKLAWIYMPMDHKTAWRGLPRIIAIPPSVQPELDPYLSGDPSAPCFSPAVLVETRRKNVGKRKAGDRFTTATLTRAIKRACVKAGVGKFSSHQLRHLGGTQTAGEHGSRAAQVFLGHEDLRTTADYLSFDEKLFFEVTADR